MVRLSNSSIEFAFIFFLLSRYEVHITVSSQSITITRSASSTCLSFFVREDPFFQHLVIMEDP
jgi:hypothetical protein